MPLCSVEEAVAELKQGKMIILVDDEDRENEGDLTMAAEFVTPEAINFMAKFGRGLICLPMAPEMADKLNLPLMTQRNGSRFGTNFTVSIEAREGITTGISAADRARTIRTAVADDARAAAEGERGLFKRLSDGFPCGGRFGCRDSVERFLKAFRECFNCGCHMFGAHGSVVDQAAGVEKRICGFSHLEFSCCQRPRRRSTASTVLVISMAIVIGPTPPGTGVMAEATSRTFS